MTVKKRLLAAVLLAALLVLAFSGTGSADGGLSFVSVDDKLPAELINAVVYSGGTVYVPYWLFTNYSLGISYQMNTSTSTATLSCGDKQMVFNLATGKTYDNDNYRYSASAMVRNGVLYFPLSFVCSFFRTFSYANIGSNEYGSILRLCTGREELTNDEFIRLAKPAMQRYFIAHGLELTPSPTETIRPTAGPTETVRPTPGGKEEHPHLGHVVRLGLVGMPDSETLELLRSSGMGACFFLTADEIRDNPDMVRRIAGEGYRLGAACAVGTAEEFREIGGLIQDAARVRTVMAVLPAEVRTPAGVVSFRQELERPEDEDLLSAAYEATAMLERSGRETTLIFPCGGENDTAMTVLCYYLRDQGFFVKALRETDGNS